MTPARLSQRARARVRVRLREIERVLSQSRRASVLRTLLLACCGAGLALGTRVGLALAVLSLAAVEVVGAHRKRALRRVARASEDEVIRVSGIYRVRD